MNKKLILLAVALTVTIGILPSVSEAVSHQRTEIECTFPVTETDATGAQVTVNEVPESIVTLSPSAAQTVWEIGGSDKVIGISKFATYLEDTRKKSIINVTSNNVDVEAVVGLNPDLVLAPDVVSDDAVAKIRQAGITVYNFGESKKISDIYQKTLLTGRLIDRCGSAQETVDWMKDQIKEVRNLVQGKEKPSVLYALGDGFTAGNNTFINDVLTTLGTNNIADKDGFYVISEETVLSKNPDWIVTSSRVLIPKTRTYNQTTAVEKNQIVEINSNYINQPAPRVVFSVFNITKTIHSDVSINIVSNKVHIIRYDEDKNGRIDSNEVRKAIGDFLFDNKISNRQAQNIIRKYLF